MNRSAVGVHVTLEMGCGGFLVGLWATTCKTNDSPVDSSWFYGDSGEHCQLNELLQSHRVPEELEVLEQQRKSCFSDELSSLWPHGLGNVLLDLMGCCESYFQPICLSRGPSMLRGGLTARNSRQLSLPCWFVRGVQAVEVSDERFIRADQLFDLEERIDSGLFTACMEIRPLSQASFPGLVPHFLGTVPSPRAFCNVHRSTQSPQCHFTDTIQSYNSRIHTVSSVVITDVPRAAERRRTWVMGLTLMNAAHLSDFDLDMISLFGSLHNSFTYLLSMFL